MPRLKRNESLCSAAQALEILGSRWTLLLIREVLFGTRRFDSFAAHLGIPRNVLADRLAMLVAEGILEMKPVNAGRREEYRLTEKGIDTLPLLIALLQWGDRWLQTPESVPVVIVDRRNKRPLARVRPMAGDGTALEWHQLDWLPGPGAGDPRIAPLIADYERQRRLEPRSIPSTPARAIEPLKKSPARRRN